MLGPNAIIDLASALAPTVERRTQIQTGTKVNMQRLRPINPCPCTHYAYEFYIYNY